MFLNTDRSRFATPGRRKLESNRAVLPKLYGAGWLNAEGSKYRFTRCETGPLKLGSFPFQFGRWPPPKLNRLLVAVFSPSGTPLRKVAMPLICHPPTTAPSHRLPDKNLLCGPTGSSQTELIASQCGASKVASARSL